MITCLLGISPGSEYTQTPEKYPEDNLSLLQHGESLKTRGKLQFYYSVGLKGNIQTGVGG
jgi:hypothetical protein